MAQGKLCYYTLLQLLQVMMGERAGCDSMKLPLVHSWQLWPGRPVA